MKGSAQPVANSPREESSVAIKSVVVNGEPVETVAATLAELIKAGGYGGAKVATAVNGDFVPERARAHRAIAAGDRIEIVAPRQGG